MDFQEHVFRKVFKTHLFGAGGASAEKVYFPEFFKDMFLKFKMKPVVKYGVY